MIEPIRIGVVIGTRPEAIKLASLVWAMEAHPVLAPIVISTGQHKELLEPILESFGLEPTYTLSAMAVGGGLAELTSRLIEQLGSLFATGIGIRALVVQGDTTSALCGTLAAFYEKIEVAHVEAGLRSDVLLDPFPEELNRRIISIAARWHFAPTERAAANLRAEGIPNGAISVTGNTVLDTLNWARKRTLGISAFNSTRTHILVTLHRRETQGIVMASLGRSIAQITELSDAETVLPLHKNPLVRRSLLPALSATEGVRVLEPMDYFTFQATLADADLIITDSGGVLEEAAFLGVPTIVCRDATERPEAIEAGTALLVGVNPTRLTDEAMALLRSPHRRALMAAAPCPFGDGSAARRILDRLERDLGT